jgi:serine/threonine protein kinase
MGGDSPARHSHGWKIEKSMDSPGNFELFLRERSGRNDFDFLAFVNILRLMLQLNPEARITASPACLYPFITGTIDIGSSRSGQ